KITQGFARDQVEPQLPAVSGSFYDVSGPETLHHDGTNFLQNHSMNLMHEIDYKVFGDAMQYVEIELDPNEAAVAEAGGMMYMDDGIEMETIFGDGSQQNSGFLGALMGAGKRLLTGESMF